MPILQISKIQHRRGLQDNLPQLSSGEIGWSQDQRRLFIGNGALDEGAPVVLRPGRDFLSRWMLPKEKIGLGNH